MNDSENKNTQEYHLERKQNHKITENNKLHGQ